VVYVYDESTELTTGVRDTYTGEWFYWSVVEFVVGYSD
jgi:hypothetical protein